MRLSNFHIKLGKLALAVLALLLIGGQAWGATYYVRPAATCTNNGDGTISACAASPGAAGAYNTINNAFAGRDLEPGDIVEVCADTVGGSASFAETVAWGSNDAGSAGNLVTLRGRAGDTITINPASGVGINAAGYNYTKIQNLTVVSANSSGVYFWNSTGNEIINCIVSGATAIDFAAVTNGVATGNVATGTATAGNAAFKCNVQGTFSISGNTATSLNAASGSYGFWLLSTATAPTITSSNNTAHDTVRDGFRYDFITDMSVTSTDDTATGAKTGYSGVSILGTSKTGVTGKWYGLSSTNNALLGFDGRLTNITWTEFIIDKSATRNFLISGNSGGPGIYLVGLQVGNVRYGTISNNSGDGIYCKSSNGPIFSYLTVSGNTTDGISFGNAGTPAEATINAVVHHCLVTGNGIEDSTGSSGDGITAHDGCTGLSIYENVLASNNNTGMAVIADSTGTAYNNTFYRNGNSTYSTYPRSRGGFYDSGTGAWVVKNNLFEGNFPKEINIAAAVLAASTFDYNSYRHVGNGVTEAQAFSIDGGTTPLAWAAYQTAAAGYSAGDEINSRYASSGISVDYTLPAGHAAIGSGVLITGLHDQATPATDFAGTPVTWGPSIGAYQPNPANVIYFDKSAGAGGNGMQSTPYNDMASYPVAKLISGTVANPLYIYLKGDFSAEALDFSSYGGPANPYVIIRTPKQNQAANLGALTVKGSNMTQQYYQSVQALPGKVWSDFTQYTTVP